MAWLWFGVPFLLERDRNLGIFKVAFCGGMFTFVFKNL